MRILLPLFWGVNSDRAHDVAQEHFGQGLESLSILNFAAGNPGLDPAGLGSAVGCHGVWAAVYRGDSVQQGERMVHRVAPISNWKRCTRSDRWTLQKTSPVGGRPFASRTRNSEEATYLPYHITMPSSPSGCAQKFYGFVVTFPRHTISNKAAMMAIEALAGILQIFASLVSVRKYGWTGARA